MVKDYHALLPEGGKDLEQQLNELLEFNQRVDEKIQALQEKLKPAKPGLSPPGTIKGDNKDFIIFQINDWQMQKAAQMDLFDQQLQPRFANLQAKEAAKLKSVVDYHLHPNDYKGTSDLEMFRQKRSHKDIEKSFEYAEQQYFSSYQMLPKGNDTKLLSFDDMSEQYMLAMDKDTPVKFDDLDLDKD